MSSKEDEPCVEGEGDCSKAASLVDLYIDEMLGVEDKTFVQQHLDGCPGCRGGYEFESALNLRVRSLAPIYMPEDVKSQILLSLGFPGMNTALDNSMSALGSPNVEVHPTISSQLGIPKGEIPRGEIPKSDFFDSGEPSSSTE